MSDKIVKLRSTVKRSTAKRSTAKRKSGAAGHSRADYVKERILKAIQAGRYKPGERIRETEVAEWLDVSRTPVREALRRLESEAILTFVSWRGVVVAELDRQQVGELYAMREVLEGAAARLAARHIYDAETDLLDDLLRRADACPDKPDELARLNRQFHQTIYAAAHNRYLTQTLVQIRNAMALLQGTTYSVPGRPDTAAAEHRDILNAIRERNPDAAEAAASTHIAAAQRARLQLLMETDNSTDEDMP